MKTPAKKPSPPGWAERLLRWYCVRHLLEEIQGDLQEEFDHQVRHAGVKKARLDYIRNVLGFIKPFAIRRKNSFTSLSLLNMNMLEHYAIVAVRNLFRYKAFSAINVVGLALGMICCMFIFLWVKNERCVDNFHVNGESLHTVYQTFISGESISGGYATPDILAAELKKAIPEVQYATAYTTAYELPWGHPETFQIGDKVHKLEGARAGEDFFKMFSYHLIAGDPDTALKDKSSIAISQKMAEMFFGTVDEAIGKSIRYENRLDFIVTGVFEDLPASSSLKFDYLVNWEMYMARQLEQASWNIRTFIQLQPGADANSVKEKIKHLWDTHTDKKAPYRIELGLQRFGDEYLHGNFENGKPGGGRIEYVKIFTGVAVFILIIACINFMNLATARSVKRAKEVGVRKVVGSSRFYLVGQFLSEATLLSLLAIALSFVFVKLMLPAFNTFTGKHIELPVDEPSFWMALVALTFTTGFAAGGYPAFFLSSMKPVRVLKGVVRFAASATWFRKGLSIFQFTLSIILLITTFVVSRQINYVQNTHLGYDRENLIYIRIEGEMRNRDRYLAFKEEASKKSGIVMIDRTSEAPHAMGFGVADAIDWEGKNKEVTVGSNSLHAVQFENGQGSAAVSFYPSSVGYDFLKLMNLKLADGRDFSSAYSTDSAAFMINETAVKQMGIKDPIGKWISAWDKKGHIIAVVKDYHINSLHEPIKPLLLDVKEDLPFGLILVRTEAGKTEEALANLEKVHKDINPGYPFACQFVDQEYEKLYRNEQVIARLSNVFAILAILISCLGLLGLVMFMAEQRTKEIGIRKVLGATMLNIVNLLSRDFLAVILVSFFIAAPVAWYYTSEWLAGFAFKIELSWWMFAFAGSAALLVAVLTISVQAIQSALANPVKSLRTE